MTAINVTSVNVLDNPSKVTNPLQFEIQYDCLYDLSDGMCCCSVEVGNGMTMFPCVCRSGMEIDVCRVGGE